MKRATTERRAVAPLELAGWRALQRVQIHLAEAAAHLAAGAQSLDLLGVIFSRFCIGK